MRRCHCEKGCEEHSGLDKKFFTSVPCRLMNANFYLGNGHQRSHFQTHSHSTSRQPPSNNDIPRLMLIDFIVGTAPFHVLQDVCGEFCDIFIHVT